MRGRASGGAWSVAAPIFDHIDHTDASMRLCGPVERSGAEVDHVPVVAPGQPAAFKHVYYSLVHAGSRPRLVLLIFGAWFPAR